VECAPNRVFFHYVHVCIIVSWRQLCCIDFKKEILFVFSSNQGNSNQSPNKRKIVRAKPRIVESKEYFSHNWFTTILQIKEVNCSRSLGLVYWILCYLVLCYIRSNCNPNYNTLVLYNVWLSDPFGCMEFFSWGFRMKFLEGLVLRGSVAQNFPKKLYLNFHS